MQEDFDSKQLENKAPPLPEKKVSWEQVLEQYAISEGGTTEEEGIGLSKDRINEYKLPETLSSSARNTFQTS